MSVIISTHNRRRELTRCLKRLQIQELSKDRFELIIVDDGSEIPVSQYSDELVGTDLDVIFLRQDHAGPSVARNLAASISRGSILAFTDDDCIPKSTWLIKGLNRLTSEENWVGLEGAIEPVLLEDSHQKLGRVVSNTAGGLFATANMFYRKEAFFAAGSFDTRFIFPYREDTELARRILRLGRIGFAPDVIVKHPISSFTLWDRALRARYIINDLHLLAENPSYFETRGIQRPSDLFRSALVTIFRSPDERRRIKKYPEVWAHFLLSVVLEKMALLLILCLPRTSILPSSMVRSRAGYEYR